MLNHWYTKRTMRKKIFLVTSQFLGIIILGVIFNIVQLKYAEGVFKSGYGWVFIVIILMIHLLLIELIRYAFYKYWPLQNISSQRTVRRQKEQQRYAKQEELEPHLSEIHKFITEKFKSEGVGICVKEIYEKGENIIVWPPKFGFTQDILSSAKELRDKFGPVIIGKSLTQEGGLEYRRMESGNIEVILYIEEEGLYRGFIFLGEKEDSHNWSDADKDRLQRLRKYIQQKLTAIIFYRRTLKDISRTK